MKSDLLHVVTVVSNPIRWQSRIRLYRDFEQHMLDSGVRLTTVECAFGERPHELAGTPHVNYVAVRASARALVWNKEPLLNLGIARLPANARYIATIDADVMFRRPDWAAETVHALQHYDVVQPWSDCYDLGPHGEHMELHRSFCRLVHDDQPIMQGPQCGPGTPYQFGHPGFAWAWTRDALDAVGGLVETAALGAADHHMAMALIGRVGESMPDGLHPSYAPPLLLWQERAMAAIRQNIGHVGGTIEHAFHGAKAKRAYVERWAVLSGHGFDPNTDLKRNASGVLELAGNKPRLRHDIDLYFRQRDEDANTLG